MDITLQNQNRIEAAVRRAITARMAKVFTNSRFLLNQQAEALRSVFAGSEEFNALKGKLKGEFGFTDLEVANLDRVLDLLVPGNHEITLTKIKTGPNQFEAILQWVDLRKLKAHEYAEHDLTRLDKAGNIVEITDTVSWVEWLEEGVTVTGYQFFRPSRATTRFGGADTRAFSRSGEGLMKPSDSGFWTFQPTRVLERIAKSENGKLLKKGFGILVRELAK